MNEVLKFSLYLLLTFVFSSEIMAQSVYGKVENTKLNEKLNYPWAGGMNAVQYCEIDLNLDGIKDMLAFDRRGNRPMCFINGGEAGAIDYQYSPEYADLLPELKNWVILADYNMDGKNDIFTYHGPGTMMVYKNVSDNVLKFEQAVYPFLKTLLPGGYVNLFVTNADYPGVADVDNDGDLDILTFGVLGSFVDMHKNMSMEKYGIPDSLDYEHYTYCWGHFAENDESNQVYLDTCFNGSNYARYDVSKKERHVGSTFLVNDLDGNGLVDILLGDVDYPQLMALYNFGSLEDAYITKVDAVYPLGDDAVNLFSMPCPSYMDINNDGIKDLIVSPFDPGIVTSRNKNSSWLYINNGSDNNPDFEFVEKVFIQKDMIDVGSGAYPVLFDWDNDGLEDLFIGNYGYYQYSYYSGYILHSVYYSQIAYYKNVGTPGNPVFQLWEKNFANLKDIKKIGLIPTFDDIDGDGYTDILLGESEGGIIYVRNKQGDEFEVVSEKFLGIDVGEFSAPQLFDIDKDGSKDLIIGEKAGNINYYHNTPSNGSSDFTFITDSLGKVNVTDYSISWDGYSTPAFFNNNGETGLLVGSEQGKVFYFTNINGNLSGTFTESQQLNTLLDTSGVDFDRGMRTGAVISSLYTDGKLSMIVGNYSGGLEFFAGDVDVNTRVTNHLLDLELNIFPVPAKDKIVIELQSKLDNCAVDIYDLKGMRVFSEYFDSSASRFVLDIGVLYNGFYILQLKTDQGYVQKKIVINND